MTNDRVGAILNALAGQSVSNEYDITVRDDLKKRLAKRQKYINEAKHDLIEWLQGRKKIDSVRKPNPVTGWNMCLDNLCDSIDKNWKNPKEENKGWAFDPKYPNRLGI